MKKMNGLIFFSTLILSCLLVSCAIGQQPNDETQSMNLIREKVFQDSTHKSSEIRIQYPEFAQAEMQKINQDIHRFATEIPKQIYGENYSDLQLQINYEIKVFNDKYLSIVFSGFGESGAAYPKNIFLTRNYDLERETSVKLSELYTIDLYFAQTIYTSVAAQNGEDVVNVFEADYPNTDTVFQALLACDTNIESCQSYLTSTGIGICMPIRHIGGDYVCIERSMH